MTTINITRRKQPIGFIRRLTISTKEGNSIALRSGETVTLSTGYPEELWVKRFLYTKHVYTGASASSKETTISLEVFYNLSSPAIIILFVTAGVLLGVAFSKLHPPGRYYFTSGIPALFVILAAGVIRRSLTIQKYPK